MTAAALLAGVLLSQSVALPEDAPVKDPPPEQDLRVSYAVPALETASVQLGFLGFNNLVTRMPFSLITWDTIQSHFDGRAGWTFDVDYFVTNQFGHPYQGSFAHAFARSAGVNFWLASLYTVAGSGVWEYFLERDPPSINDQITTTLGGIFLGEVVHRSYVFLTEDTDLHPWSWRNWVGTVVSPASALNRWLFNDQARALDIDQHPRFHASFTPGITVATRFFDRTGGERRLITAQGPQLLLEGEVDYGAPGDPDWEYSGPFSYWNLSIGTTLPGTPTANLYIRGLLAGRQFGGPDTRARGLGGLFGLYDFGGNNIVRASSVGIGPGVVMQVDLGNKWFVRGTLVGAALGFAAAGSLGLNPDLARDYHIGPGFEVVLDSQLVRVGLGTLGLRVRQWTLNGFYVPPRDGYEAVTYSTLTVQGRVARQVSVGIELPTWIRAYGFGEGTQEVIAGSGPRLFATLFTDDVFGVHPD